MSNLRLWRVRREIEEYREVLVKGGSNVGAQAVRSGS